MKIRSLLIVAALTRGGGLWLLSPQRFWWQKAWPAKLWH